MSLAVHFLNLQMSNAFLLENEHGLYLVDAGVPASTDRILQEIRNRGKPLRLIFITHAHFDHYGCAAAVRAKTDAPIAIHTADAQEMTQGRTPIGSVRGRARLLAPALPLIARMHNKPTTPDLLLQDGAQLDDFGLPAYLLHTPGHTPGSSCLIVKDEEAGICAFVGDLITGGYHPHVQHLFADDWAQIPTSLERLQTLTPDWVYPGHGSRPISGDLIRGL